jgi:hypothetical protein
MVSTTLNSLGLANKNGGRKKKWHLGPENPGAIVGIGMVWMCRGCVEKAPVLMLLSIHFDSGPMVND